MGLYARPEPAVVLAMLRSPAGTRLHPRMDTDRRHARVLGAEGFRAVQGAVPMMYVNPWLYGALVLFVWGGWGFIAWRYRFRRTTSLYTVEWRVWLKYKNQWIDRRSDWTSIEDASALRHNLKNSPPGQIQDVVMIRRPVGAVEKWL